MRSVLISLATVARPVERAREDLDLRSREAQVHAPLTDLDRGADLAILPNRGPVERVRIERHPGMCSSSGLVHASILY